MEWSDIRIFLQVVREGTMVGATGALRMDHSTISRRIARLEREAAVQLFERAGRRLALTAEGEKFRASAEKLESIILREILSLSGAGEQVSGPVRIGTTEEFGAHYLAGRLSALTAAHPGLEIELVASPRTFSLATREVDIVIGLDRPMTGDIRYKKLTDLEFGVYGAASYFQNRSRPATMEALLAETWCGYIAELLFTPELELFPRGAGESNVRYRTTSVTAQLGAALGGHALATLPSFLADAHAELECLLPEQARFERSYWMAVHEDLAKYPRVRAVMDAIETQVVADRNMFRPSILPSRRTPSFAAEEFHSLGPPRTAHRQPIAQAAVADQRAPS